MELEFDRARWTQDADGVWLSLRAIEPVQARRFAAGIKPVRYMASLAEKRKKRSPDANAYLWVLCQKIAEAVRNLTKEEVYKAAVRQAGQFEILPIRCDAEEAFIRKWTGRGAGWLAERQDESKLPGYVRVIAYYGSSVYDSREMAALLDYVVSEAKDLGIETATPEELARMEEGWNDAQADQGG